MACLHTILYTMEKIVQVFFLACYLLVYPINMQVKSQWNSTPKARIAENVPDETKNKKRAPAKLAEAHTLIWRFGFSLFFRLRPLVMGLQIETGKPFD